MQTRYAKVHISRPDAIDLANRAARGVLTEAAVKRLAEGAQTDIKVLNRLRKADASTDPMRWAKIIHEALDLAPRHRRPDDV